MACWPKALAPASAIIWVALAAEPAGAACTPPDCALDFGSSGAHVTFGNPSALGLASFTLETWFVRQGAGSSVSTGTGGVSAIPLVTKGRGEADGNDRDMNWFLGIRASDGVLAADFEEGAGGTSPGLNHPVTGTTAIANGIWHHAAATYDGNSWRLYLDGRLEAELAVGQPPRSDSIQRAALATAQNSSGVASGAFDGVLDEVRVWNVARTQTEIQAAINSELAGDPNLVARWGLDEGSGTVVGDSSGTAQNGTLTGSGASWETGSPFDLNLPPAAPGLVGPADAGAGVALPPLLEVSVSDPDADPMAVRFFGREAPGAAAEFTLIALPDTQYYSSSLNGGSPAIFDSQTQWIVDQRASREIAYVAQLGDCVEHGNNDSEWLAADAAISLIENPLTTLLPDGIPFGIAVGNHDQSPQGNPDGSSTTRYNAFFGESRFLGRAYYGGHYGSNNDNHYDLFSAGGMDFIVVVLEYDTTPEAAVLAWADALLQTHASRRAIVVSHYIIDAGGSASFGAQGHAIYDALKDNPNLFLMLSGHVCSEGRRQDGFGGSTVHSLLSDYQCDPAGGNGWLRILTFRPAQNEIEVETYSPWLDQYRSAATSAFTLSYDMGGAGFVPIGTQAAVASGADASAAWSGLAAGTRYQWYASADDGSRATAGPIWSFTTAACGDGLVASDETCDDGGTTGGDGCSASCQIETCFACIGEPSVCTPDDGASCDDGLFCNGADVCGGGTCTHAGDPCAGGGECADTCDEGADSCEDPLGTACTADGNPCTDDACDGAGACGVANTAQCDDGLFCNGADVCGGGTCTHAGDPCAGGGECADACDEGANSCEDPLGTACTVDGDACSDDVCDGAGVCGVANTSACDDGDGCCPAGCNPGNDDDCAAALPSVPTLRPIALLCLAGSLLLSALALTPPPRIRAGAAAPPD